MEMGTGKSLHDVCEAVLDSSRSELPGEISNFIVLGDFRAVDVMTGDLKDKYRIFEINIGCGASVKNEEDAEMKAEERSYEISRIVRTILKANRKLISTSYPSGIAKSSTLLGDSLDFYVYLNTVCSINTVMLEAKIKEED